MAYCWVLIFVSFVATNSPEKAESVQLEELEELPLQTFDELFVDEWWDKAEAEDFTTDQNPPLIESDHSGQIKPNSTDQNPLLTESDQLGQIEPNSTDQNPPLTESDHSNNSKNGKEQNEIMKEITSNNKRKIIDKFHAIKEEFKQKGKYSKNKWVQIENRIAKHLKVNRSKIYKWKKEFGLRQKVLYEKEEREHFVEKFDQRKAELKRAGFKNSYPTQINETVAKELGLCFRTIYKWKRELGQTAPYHKYSHSEQKKLIKRYYEIKDKNPKISDADIAKMFKIVRTTLVKWKKQFKRHAANVQETEA